LARNKQTVFYLEDFDFSWFQTWRQRAVASLLVGASSSIAAGMLLLFMVEIVLGRISGYGLGLAVALLSWLSIGLIFGLVAMSVKLKPAETLTFSIRQIPSRLAHSVRPEVLVAVAFFVAFWFEIKSADIILIE